MAAPTGRGHEQEEQPAPTAGRRRESSPARAASARVARETVASRIGLSAVPTRAMTNSLTGVGVRSITTDPTERTGDAAAFVTAATR